MLLLPTKEQKLRSKNIIIIVSSYLLAICIFSPSNTSSFVTNSQLRYKINPFQSRTTTIAYQSLNNNNNNGDGHYVEVIYENHKSIIFVPKNESILSALENAKIGKTLCLSTLPFECRKGNCLTCVGKIIQNSKETDFSLNINKKLSLVRQEEDGLEPNLSDEIKNSGYVLTCSTYVINDGLTIELGRKDEVWDYVYRDRIINSQQEQVRNDASASAITSFNERNLSTFIDKIEKVLQDDKEDAYE